MHGARLCASLGTQVKRCQPRVSAIHRSSQEFPIFGFPFKMQIPPLGQLDLQQKKLQGKLLDFLLPQPKRPSLNSGSQSSYLPLFYHSVPSKSLVVQASGSQTWATEEITRVSTCPRILSGKAVESGLDPRLTEPGSAAQPGTLGKLPSSLRVLISSPVKIR